MLGSLLVSLGLESGEFKSGLTAAEKQLRASAKRIEAVGKSMQGLGTKLTLGLTAPLAAFGVASIKAANESADAMAQVNAALKSMGSAAGYTNTQLAGLASGLMRNSLYDDDEILRKVTANMLTFGKVAGANFKLAQQAAVDLAARMGTDLQSAALMVGKALNDPIKGLSALGRAGIQFTAQQKDQIKAMAAAGDAAGAQAVMLKELERQFGGSAAAAANANPFAKLKHSFDDLQEAVGGILLKVLPPLTDALNRALDLFNNMSPGMQTFAVNAALIAAALGPVLTVIGTVVSVGSTLFAALGSIGASMAATGTVAGALEVAMAAVGSAFAALAPLALPLAAIAAVGALIYTNWDKIAPVLTELWQGPFGELLRAAGERIAEVGRQFMEAIGPDLIALVKGLGSVVVDAFRLIGDALSLVGALLTGRWGEAWAYAQKAVMDAVRIISGVIDALVPGAVQAMANMVSGVRLWLVTKLDAIWTWVTGKIDTVKRAFFGLYDAVVGHSYIPDMVDGIAAEMARLDKVMVDPTVKATQKAGEAIRDLAAQTRSLMDELFPDSAKAREAQDKWSLIDKAETAGIAGGGVDVSTAEQMRRKFVAGLAEINVAANDNADKVETANVRVVKSFKDMADETLGSLQNLANSIKGGSFLDILGGLLNLGLQLGSIGAFGKTVQGRVNSIPKHANGTNFAHGGLSLVGERGPELVNMPRGAQVIPNRDLRGMAGRQVVEIVDTTGLFVTRVNGQIMQAAPGIVSAGGNMGSNGAQVAMARQKSRSIP